MTKPTITVTITGLAGCGKSTLARKIFKLLAEDDSGSGYAVLLKDDVTSYSPQRGCGGADAWGTGRTPL